VRRSPRRPQTERREQIAGAALRLLGRGGLEAVTSAALAREVRVTPGALFRHFATLDEIVVAAVARAVARLAATLPPDALPPVDWLRALARDRVALLREEPGIGWLLRSEQAPSSLPASALDLLRGAILASRIRIDAAIRRGVEEGLLRSDVPAAVLRTVFTAMVHSLTAPRGVAQRAVRPIDPEPLLSGLLVLLRTPSTESRR
jgi:AcrR family transcriptional regulator